MKKFIGILWIISWALSAQAVDFSMGAQHAGYLGDKVIFAGVENEAGSLGLDFLLGRSEDSDGQRVDQISLKFRYAPWALELPRDFSWQPVYMGLFLTTTDGGEFFFESGSQYPEKNYYDATMVRYGLLLGTMLVYKSIGVYTELALLEKSLQSQVVSEEALPWGEILSAAVGLRWHF